MTTVHDLAFFAFPETVSIKQKLWWNYGQRICLNRTDHIVADSENTKKDIINHFKISPDKISVIYCSVIQYNESFSSEECTQVREKYGLPKDYILFVGSPHKRKNLYALLQAYELLRKKNQFPHKLVLVGPSGWDLKNLLEQIKRMNLEENILLTNFVADDELRIIYHLAEIFVFPSLYEGFGYPPLESMACRTPVVVSNSSSIPEVVGDAGVYFDPINIEEMANKIHEVLNSKKLQQELIEKGLKRVSFFSVEKMIKFYSNLYTKLCIDNS